MLKITTKKTLSILVISVFFVMSILSFGFIFDFNIAKTAKAEVINPESITVNVNNGNFASNGTGAPAAVNDFTKLDGFNSSQLVRGIISTYEPSNPNTDVTNSFTKNAKAYNLLISKNPKTPIIADEDESNTDYNVLMLNNLKADGTNNPSPAAAGYKTETALTFEANTYYKLTVYALSYGGAQFSLYLNEITENKDTTNLNLSFEGVSTTTWQPFNFFFKTNNLYDITANLEMWLGSKPALETNASTGAVFFDNISLKKLTSAAYQIQKDNSTFVETIDLTNSKIFNDNIIDNNFDFEMNTNPTQIDSWTVSEKTGNSFIAETKPIGSNFTFNDKSISVMDNRMHANITGTSMNINKFAALLYSGADSSENGQTYGSIKSKEFKIDQQGIYKISVWAYVGDSTSASAQLNIIRFEKNANEVGKLETKNTANLTISSITDRPISNNYKQYSFLVYGHKNFDSFLNLELGIGSEETKTYGYALFDDVTIEKLNSTEAELTKSNCTKFEISAYSDPETGVSNPYFNNAEKIELTDNTANAAVLYPIKNVSNWTYNADSSNKDDLISGIIDTNSKHFASHKHLYKMNDYINLLQNGQTDTINATNNVLLLNNISNLTYQSYTSTTYSLDVSSFYSINVDAIRSTLSTGNAYIIVKTENSILAQIPVKATNRWETNTIYISTGLRKFDISLELAVGISTQKANGDALFDNVIINTIEKDAFINASSNVTKIDFTKENFNVRKDQNANINYLYSTPAFNGASTDNILFGVYSLTDHIPEYLKVGAAANTFNDNILYLSNNTYTSFSTTSALDFNLEADKYYKLSIVLKTQNITCEPGFVEEENLKYGLNIALTGIDQKFEGIKNTNGYIEYNFYIGANAARTLNFVLNLGTEAAKTKGRVFVNQLSAEEITQTIFTEATSHPSASDNVENIVINDITEKSEEPAEEKTESAFDWIYIPSIIITLALIIVIVGVCIKNIKLPKNKKRLKNEYDKIDIEEAKLLEEYKTSKKQKRNKRKNKEDLIIPSADELTKTEEILENFDDQESNLNDSQVEITESKKENLDSIKDYISEDTNLELNNDNADNKSDLLESKLKESAENKDDKI